MWNWITSVLTWLFKKEGAAIAIEGYDRLYNRQNDWIERTEKRLDDCERDRDELHKKMGCLEIKVDECESDRRELRERIEVLETNSQTI